MSSSHWAIYKLFIPHLVSLSRPDYNSTVSLLQVCVQYAAGAQNKVLTDKIPPQLDTFQPEFSYRSHNNITRHHDAQLVLHPHHVHAVGVVLAPGGVAAAQLHLE